jgi:hypothetical protein
MNFIIVIIIGRPPKDTTDRPPKAKGKQKAQPGGNNHEESEPKRTKTSGGDRYIGKPVAFSVVEEPWMTNKEYGKLGSWYLAGNVTRRELVSSTIEATTEYGDVQLNQRGKPFQVSLLNAWYEIKWNLTDFNGKKFTHMIPLETVRRGRFIH